jgi:hypothetical protein
MTIIFGCLSYACAVVLLLVDSVLWGFHYTLQALSQKCISDGDKLTGWKVDVANNG